MQINKSKLFKDAWGRFKLVTGNGLAYSFSEALKWAWKYAKEDAVKNIGIAIETARETAKAVAAQVEIFCNHTDQSRTSLIWFPKSWLNADGTVPQNVFSKKIKQLKEESRYPTWALSVQIGSNLY